MKDLLDKWYEKSGQIAPVRIPRLTRRRLVEHFAEAGLASGVEVGVDRGKFSDVMLGVMPSLRLLCVDIWHWRFKGESAFTSTVRRLAEHNGGPVPVFVQCKVCGGVMETDDSFPFATTPRCPDCSEWDQRPQVHRSLVDAQRVLAAAEGPGIILRMNSLEAARLVADESLDFCYIDGDHRFDGVMADLIFWGRKVRPGGVVALHDFYRFRHAGVVPAVEAYTRQHGVERWFLTDEKCATAFWVREPNFVDAPYSR